MEITNIFPSMPGSCMLSWGASKISLIGSRVGLKNTILSNRSDGLAGKLRNDYYMTIDMAKELSMVERTARGKET